MKRICGSPLVAALVMFCVLSVSACKPTSNGGNAPFGWDDVVECTEGVIPSVIDSVTRILIDGVSGQKTLSQAAEDELTDLAKEHGSAAVVCAIDKLASDWTAPGATQERERMGAVQRGRAFLDDKGIEVKHVDGPHSALMPPRECDDTLGAPGFVPVGSPPGRGDAWHVMLASARGCRS